MRSPRHRLVALARIILGRGALLRTAVSVVALTLCIIVVAIAADVLAPIRKTTNIPAQSLSAALQELAKERNFQLVYVSEDVDSLRTQGAVGDLTPAEALQQLLEGTGLTFRYLDEKTVVIVPTSASRQPQDHAQGWTHRQEVVRPPLPRIRAWPITHPQNYGWYKQQRVP